MQSFWSMLHKFASMVLIPYATNVHAIPDPPATLRMHSPLLKVTHPGPDSTVKPGGGGGWPDICSQNL